MSSRETFSFHWFRKKERERKRRERERARVRREINIMEMATMAEAGTGAAPLSLCCMCGITMRANKINTCAQCLQTTHDVTKSFSKNGVLLWCKGCEKYQKAGADGFIECQPESKPLLALCLKKIKGLNEVSVIDARFVWTEEHSKRIKVKLKVQKEVAAGVVLQQECIVEFVVQNKFCDDCHAKEAHFSWDSVVQLRQKVSHKRTFLFLEQLIIKHSEDQRTINVEPQPEGVDFFFAAKNDAARFLDFLETVIPLKYKVARQIVALDTKSNIAKYNTTFSVEIVPVCKDDIVCLPLSVARKAGNIPRIVLCQMVSNIVRFINPETCQVCELTAETFWRTPFRSLMTAQQLKSYVVLDVQMEEAPLTRKQQQRMEGTAPDVAKSHSKKRRRKGGKSFASVLTADGVNVSPNHAIALIEVAREEDLGVNDKRFLVKSHLGFVLKPGDTCLGYDMSTLVFNDKDAKNLKSTMPDIVLVRKSYPKWRKLSKERNWKLKSLVQNGPEEAGFGIAAKPSEKEDPNYERDREMFMRDLEEDADMRARINIYKSDTKRNANIQEEHDQDEDYEEDAPRIELETLLDEMDISDNKEQSKDHVEDDDQDSL